MTSPTIVISLLETYGKTLNKSNGFIKSVTKNVKEGSPLKGPQKAFVREAIKNADPGALQSLLKNGALLGQRDKGNAY